MTDIVDKRNRRRMFQKVKSMSNDQFDRFIANLFDQYYGVAVGHATEAMEIELTPKQRARVLAKMKEISELWDGLF